MTKKNADILDALVCDLTPFNNEDLEEHKESHIDNFSENTSTEHQKPSN
jgi:hypothetical protein